MVHTQVVTMSRIVGSHNRLVGTPFRTPTFVLRGRDANLLNELSTSALDGLTNCLTWPEHKSINDMGVCDSRATQAVINTLDYRVKRPSGLRDRIAVRLGARGFFSIFPEVASLCEAHYELDPRVIRNVMKLVYAEAMARTDKYRYVAKGPQNQTWNDLTTNVISWIDLMDTIVLTRLNAAQFSYQYEYSPTPLESGLPGGGVIGRVPSRNECEACTLSFVGGSPRLLAALKLGAQLRSEGYMRGRKGMRPRLWPILESWCRHLQPDERVWVDEWVEGRIEDLRQARDVILGGMQKKIQEVRDMEERILIAKFRAKADYQFDFDPDFNTEDFAARAAIYCPCRDITAATFVIPDHSKPNEQQSDEKTRLGRLVHNR